ncbi:MAG TPA: hypothetical protein VGO66_06940 [Solirubrobacterales bacterium]|jgi:hypothetical protein|nr:hypothetical protein [Solirubrobacterales bacterium]
MKGKPRTARGIASLAVSAVTLAVAMALAIPALAHHGSDNSDFGDRDPAGTIASFDQGSKVLTVDLGDGGTVSGLVTRWTWIDNGDRDCDDRRHLSGDWCRRQLHGSGDDHGGHHWGGRGDTDDLVPGAVVEDAVLGLADGRAFFVKVDLDD